MSSYFFDTSALLKRYWMEIGTLWVNSITRPSAGHRIFVAQLTRVEIMSGIARRVREGTITPRTAHAIRLSLQRHLHREYTVIPLLDDILSLAEDLVERHPLRSADAIQLATALHINQRIVSAGLSPLTFLSGDAKLVNAATSEGLLTDNPNLHP